jgi:hypothetical protein
MLKEIFATSLFACAAGAAFSQDSTKTSPLTITGSADVYYRYDFGGSKANNLTSFTNSHNSFELGMASVKFNYKAGKTELVADLGLGKRAREFAYNDGDMLASVKQLYGSFSPATWVKFTAGTWATHVGYEVPDAYLNRNYSMSYMFTNGPFFHTGIKAEFTHKTHGFMLGIANPTDFKYVPDDVLNKKFLIAQYSFAPSDLFKAYVNYVGGKNVDTTETSQFDLVLTSKLSPKFSIGYNGTVNRTTLYLGNKRFAETSSWWGSALYLNMDPSPGFGVTLRGEYFNDANQLKVYSAHAKGGNVFATTLSANIKADNLIFIPEFRIDRASRSIFTNKDGKAVKSTGSFLLAAIYQF